MSAKPPQSRSKDMSANSRHGRAIDEMRSATTSLCRGTTDPGSLCVCAPAGGRPLCRYYSQLLQRPAASFRLPHCKSRSFAPAFSDYGARFAGYNHALYSRTQARPTALCGENCLGMKKARTRSEALVLNAECPIWIGVNDSTIHRFCASSVQKEYTCGSAKL